MGTRNSSTPNFEAASQEFIDAGIPEKALLPIAPINARLSGSGDLEEKVLGKAPGRYLAKRDEWRGLGGAIIAAGVSEEARSFLSWPTPNVGVLGRFLPGIDSDANSEDARRLVEDALAETFGRDAGIAERIRGTGPRRLYAFEALFPDDPDRRVRTRHVAYTLKNDAKGDKPHKLDVIGYGAQYLIAGDHANGRDRYEWHPDFPLAGLYKDETLERIENDDIVRFLDVLKRLVEERGGEWLRASGGSAPGLERDYSKLAPVVDPRDLFDALEQDLPNTEENFPEREDAVSILSAVRAALGEEAEEWTDEVREWFTRDGFADDEYFDKIWNSLRTGQRMAQDTILRRLAKVGNNLAARQDFPSDHAEEMAPHRERKAAQKEEGAELLRDAAKRYVFGIQNTRSGDDSVQMRSAWAVDVSWPAKDWWKGESLDLATDFLFEIQGLDKYAGKAGLFNFLRDLKRLHPASFYIGETLDPNHERGEIVKEPNPDGSTANYVNVRYLSQTLAFARRPSKHPQRDRQDAATVLEFVNRLFGADLEPKLAAYELDTLAYMLQTGKRPGHLLFLVGDQGVGKSIYSNMLKAIYDGIGGRQGGLIDGTKLTNDSARRFAFATIEGCRIVSIKELPDGSTAAQMAQITAALKQLVDAGPDADWVQVERKGRDSVSIRNHCRVVISSNYKTAIQIEQQDRRTFYVESAITLANKPSDDYYGEVLDVTENPERLAAFVRVLMDRDVSHYRASNPPPMTRAKSAAQLSGYTDPVQRHAKAAVMTLTASGRFIFDMREVCNVMTCLSRNEEDNGGPKDSREYDSADRAVSMQVGRFLLADCEKFKSYKTDNGSKRLPTIYATKKSRDEWGSVVGYRKGVLDLLDENRDSFPHLVQDHPVELFAGPVSTDDQS